MDNVYFKKLPSEALPLVRENNVVIVETASGKLYWCDSSGAKRLMSADEEHPVNSLFAQFYGTPTPAEKYGGAWSEDETYAGRAFVGSGAGYTLGATGGEATHNHTSGNPTDADTSLHALIQYNYSNGETVINETEGNYSAGWTPKQTVVTSGSRAYAGQQRAAAVKVVGNVSTESSMQPYKVITIWKRTA